MSQSSVVLDTVGEAHCPSALQAHSHVVVFVAHFSVTVHALGPAKGSFEPALVDQVSVWAAHTVCAVSGLAGRIHASYECLTRLDELQARHTLTLLCPYCLFASNDLQLVAICARLLHYLPDLLEESTRY